REGDTCIQAGYYYQKEKQFCSYSHYQVKVYISFLFQQQRFGDDVWLADNGDANDDLAEDDLKIIPEKKALRINRACQKWVDGDEFIQEPVYSDTEVLIPGT